MGGGGDTVSTQAAEFPPEFRPLATSAVGQIQALQNLLPLAGFGTFAPQGTAGVSPFQQAAMNLVPRALTPTTGLAALYGTANPLGLSALSAMQAGQQTPGAQQALRALGLTGVAPPSVTPNQFAAAIPQVVPPQSIVPGMSAAEVAGLFGQLQRPLPTTTPTVTAPGQVSPQSFPNIQDFLAQQVQGGLTGLNIPQLVQQAIQAALPPNTGSPYLLNPNYTNTG